MAASPIAPPPEATTPSSTAEATRATRDPRKRKTTSSPPAARSTKPTTAAHGSRPESQPATVASDLPDYGFEPLPAKDVSRVFTKLNTLDPIARATAAECFYAQLTTSFAAQCACFLSGREQFFDRATWHRAQSAPARTLHSFCSGAGLGDFAAQSNGFIVTRAVEPNVTDRTCYQK